MRAYSLIRSQPSYRAEAFAQGLRAAGYEVQNGVPANVNQGDVVLGWNRYGTNHLLAERVEMAGGVYLCAENAYIWVGGVSPHDLKDRPAYALARGWHNDSTVVREGQEDRWGALGVTVKPWREDGGHILVCPNRPFGAPGRAMPANWEQDVRSRLAKLTRREIRLRPHPGNNPPAKPLADDLAGCWAMVIWGSSAGVHALVAGIPVICEAPFWICKGATFDSATSSDIIIPWPGADARRLNALQRLAHAQWSVEEIAAGEPFRRLLHSAEQVEVAASA